MVILISEISNLHSNYIKKDTPGKMFDASDSRVTASDVALLLRCHRIRCEQCDNQLPGKDDLYPMMMMYYFGLGTNSTRFHVEITIINFIYYYYLTIGGLGFGVWGLGV